MAFDREIAAFTVAIDASNASSFERSCVASAIVNSVKDGRFGKTLAAVCLKRLSELNDAASRDANLERAALMKNTDPVMLDCVVQIAAALSGWPDHTNGATHYHDRSSAPPAWTQSATVTLETERFRFYSNVK